jgi:serine/threonine protein kinase
MQEVEKLVRLLPDLDHNELVHSLTLDLYSLAGAWAKDIPYTTISALRDANVTGVRVSRSGTSYRRALLDMAKSNEDLERIFSSEEIMRHIPLGEDELRQYEYVLDTAAVRGGAGHGSNMIGTGRAMAHTSNGMDIDYNGQRAIARTGDGVPLHQQGREGDYGRRSQTAPFQVQGGNGPLGNGVRNARAADPLTESERKELEEYRRQKMHDSESINLLGKVTSDDWYVNREDPELGSGSFSKVMLRHLFGKPVAAKEFFAERTSDENFLNQVYWSARLRHPFIVGYLGYFHEPGQTKVIFYEKMFGSVHHELMVKPTGDLVAINVRLRWALQATEAIEHLHNNGIVHRDINSKNMLLSRDYVVKISDFSFLMRAPTSSSNNGATSALSSSSSGEGSHIVRAPSPVIIGSTDDVNSMLPEEQRIVGTMRYLSPEMCSRSCHNFKASDVWSLGLTILDIITATIPHSKLKESEIRDLLIEMFKTEQSIPSGSESFFEDQRFEDPIWRTDVRLAELRDCLRLCLCIRPANRCTIQMLRQALEITDQHFGSRNTQLVYPGLQTLAPPSEPCFTFAKPDLFKTRRG